MTVAVCVKVQDGIVLAADSATTLPNPNGGVANIYNHANKIVNLNKSKPIGFMTWGLGGFNSVSIAGHAKDFRRDWDSHLAHLANPDELETVALALQEFLRERSAEDLARLPEGERGFGCLVAGHSPTQNLGRALKIETDPMTGEWSDPQPAIADDHDAGIAWFGDPRWIARIVLGFDPFAITTALEQDFGLDPSAVPQALDLIRARSTAPMVHPAMPIQDAINLGRFLVDLTKHAVGFIPEPLTVGGPTEIAAITRHEGFKWVERKLYFSGTLNPVELNGTTAS